MKFQKPCQYNDQPELLMLLHKYSMNCAINSSEKKDLLNRLEEIQAEYRFPAVDPDVGKFLSFLTQLKQPKQIFEFGSGYGHSAFWYFENNYLPEKVFLTEKRDDLESVFDSIEWPKEWRNRMEYFQSDAFDRFEKIDDHSIDMILMDGQKAKYLDFLKLAIEKKLSKNGLIIIDNAFWKGTFLKEAENQNKSTLAIGDLHQFIADSKLNKSFIPISDGLLLLSQLNTSFQPVRA